MASGGIDTFYGMSAKFKNETQIMQSVINNRLFIDIAKVTASTGSRVDCTSGARAYTNIEVLILGVNGYGVKMVPAIGDRVLLLAPRESMESVENYNPKGDMPPYDRSGIKAVPLTDSRVAQLITLDKDKLELSGPNKILLDNDGIAITDKNNNIIKLTESGVEVTDKNNNIIKLTESGVEVTDKNNNTTKMSSDGVTITDCNNNSITMSSSSVSIQGPSGLLEIS